MKKSIILLFVCVCCLGSAIAQRVHTSQFYSIPLLLNPALTGNSNYSLRAGVNYRNQWKSVAIPFVSQSVYADGKLSGGFLGSSWLGIGGMFFNDKSGEGALRTTRATFALSFNKNLNSDNTFFMHAGVGVTLVNKSVNYDQLTFDNQWNGRWFDPGLITGDMVGKQSLFYPDFSAGVLFTAFLGTSSLFFGGSLSNINQPNESFYKITNNLKRKLAIHGGFDAQISSFLYLKPQFMYTSDGKVDEIICGANCVTPFGDSRTSLYYGLWYRFSKDIIPTIGVELNRLRLLVSYDTSIASEDIASVHKGGIELSLTYYLNLSGRDSWGSRKRGIGGALPCPKFLR